MTRNRASAKAAGARFERTVADYLAAQIDDRIDRRAKTGSKDRGDITGWRHAGMRLVAELKDYGGRFLISPWLAEAEIERRNDDAHVGLVIAKRRGTTRPGQQVVFMTLDDLVTLLTTRATPGGPMTTPCRHCNTTARHSDRTGCCASCGRLFKGLAAFDRHWTTPEAGTRVCVDPLTVESGGQPVYETVEVAGGVAYRFRAHGENPHGADR